MDYYEIHAHDYFDKTVSADPSGFLSPFVRFLFPRARILDIGCGSGRDLRWLIQQGFEPTGLERSSSLAALARKYSGCPVIVGDLETFDFSVGLWDAVMMVGSLVHIPHECFYPVIQQILSGLSFPCIILVTMKEGDGRCKGEDGRTFYLWSESSLNNIFLGMNLKTTAFFRNVSAIGSQETWLGYVLIKTGGEVGTDMQVASRKSLNLTF